MATREKMKIVMKCKSTKKIERPSCPESLCSVTAVVIGVKRSVRRSDVPKLFQSASKI